MLLGKIGQYFGFEMKPQDNAKLASKFELQLQKSRSCKFSNPGCSRCMNAIACLIEREKERIFFRFLEKAYYFVNAGLKIYKPAPKG